jgi:hypothetical protein
MTRAVRLVPGRPAARAQAETAAQVALFDWITLVGRRQYPDLDFCMHPANGELRMPHVCARLKRMGVNPGCPDVLLLAPRRDFSGLAIEMKARRGNLTPDQRAWHAWLTAEGWCVRVCRSWEAARDVLVWYVQEEETP